MRYVSRGTILEQGAEVNQSPRKWEARGAWLSYFIWAILDCLVGLLSVSLTVADPGFTNGGQGWGAAAAEVERRRWEDGGAADADPVSK